MFYTKNIIEGLILGSNMGRLPNIARALGLGIAFLAIYGYYFKNLEYWSVIQIGAFVLGCMIYAEVLELNYDD